MIKVSLIIEKQITATAFLDSEKELASWVKENAVTTVVEKQLIKVNKMVESDFKDETILEDVIKDGVVQTETLTDSDGNPVYEFQGIELEKVEAEGNKPTYAYIPKFSDKTVKVPKQQPVEKKQFSLAPVEEEVEVSVVKNTTDGFVEIVDYENGSIKLMAINEVI